MSSTRTRHACSACTRRKVKCSKTVPCSHCIRRGEEATCSSDAGSTPSFTAIHADSREVDALRSRILELETHLRQTPTSATSPHVSTSSINEQDPRDAHRRTSTSPSSIHLTRAPESNDAVAEDAASILEFLAWGRRKNRDYNSVISPEASAQVPSLLGDVRDALPEHAFPDVLDQTSSIDSLQLLLPAKKQLLALVHYHERCLLWVHCSYYAPAFRGQLEVFYDRFQGSITSPGLNLQWLALLFAIMTGSLVCAPEDEARAWGFRHRERETLCKRWFRAVYTCLNHAEYAANQSILSVQAISSMTISAHLLGFSNVHSIHLAAAVRIAQSLGLHRISDESSDNSADKECGRRLWSQLCCQDWFSIPFCDAYLINPLYSQSALPLNCHDEQLFPLPDSTPTITSYTRLLYRVATIMPQLQDDLMSCNTPFTKYEQVVKWDKRMRALSTIERPRFLSNVPLEDDWPCYVPWTRRTLAVTSSHKIIMIHRCFLSESFTNPVFSFTRRTCLAASKTIIKEFRTSLVERDPILWTHQAFSVAAGVILILDILHRNTSEPEYDEHLSLVQETVELLGQCRHSMIATRGVKLLAALHQEASRYGEGSAARKRRHDGSYVHEAGNTTSAKQKGFSLSTFVQGFCNGPNQAVAAPESSNRGVTNFQTSYGSSDVSLVANAYSSSSNAALDYRLPSNDATRYPPGMEGSTPFDDLLYLANHDFSFM